MKTMSPSSSRQSASSPASSHQFYSSGSIGVDAAKTGGTASGKTKHPGGAGSDPAGKPCASHQFGGS
jgi:hypothetical protein